MTGESSVQDTVSINVSENHVETCLPVSSWTERGQNVCSQIHLFSMIPPAPLAEAFTTEMYPALS